MRSNLWSIRANVSAIAVVFESIHKALVNSFCSDPGTTVGGSWFNPTLKPVGHQSTNWMVLLYGYYNLSNQVSSERSSVSRRTDTEKNHNRSKKKFSYPHLFFFICLIAILTSDEATSPRASKKQLIYFPCFGSILAIKLLELKQAPVNSSKVFTFSFILSFACNGA